VMVQFDNQLRCSIRIPDAHRVEISKCLVPT
jgi:hypothetical protein